MSPAQVPQGGVGTGLCPWPELCGAHPGPCPRSLLGWGVDLPHRAPPSQVSGPSPSWPSQISSLDPISRYSLQLCAAK